MAEHLLTLRTVLHVNGVCGIFVHTVYQLRLFSCCLYSAAVLENGLSDGMHW